MVIRAESPAQIAEQFLIESIWNHRFAPGQPLPAERELADLIGITRTTLREVLQRLARDGWLTIKHGKPTQVNNIWDTAGLKLLEMLVLLEPERCPQLIEQLLSSRTHISAIYICGALKHAALESGAILKTIPNMDTTPNEFSAFDYRAHHELARLSGNPIYVLILNGFQKMYSSIGHYYFRDEQARSLARRFYQQLGELAQHNAADKVYDLCFTYGRETGVVWERVKRSMPQDWPDMLVETLYSKRA